MEEKDHVLNTSTEEARTNEADLPLDDSTNDGSVQAPEQADSEKDKSLHKRFLLLSVVSGVLLLILIALGLTVFSQKEKKSAVEKTDESQQVSLNNPFDSVSISAKAAYIFDAQTGEVLYSKNNKAQLPLASITKLMTAVMAAEKLPLESTVSIKHPALAAEGDSGLVLGEKWNVKDLISFTLLVSSNDGASALAHAAGTVGTNPDTDIEKTFTDSMNEKAREIGLAQTYFLNPTGLDTNQFISGGYGSAQDVVSLLYYALANTDTPLEATREPSVFYKSLDNTLHGGDNTNSTVSNIPGLIASKTGLTDLAGGNLVIAFDAGINHPIFIAVLGSTAEGRFLDVETLVEKTLETIYLQGK